jgi:STE24 endopeptidase
VSLAGASIVMIILINLLVPTVILPLFYDFTDLEDGELKTAIFAESEKTNIPVSQIKVIDGSKRSSHSNAFVTGFGSFRKVVLFDTLLESHSHAEILAVVNHELGHVAHMHILQNVAMTTVQLTLMFTLFSFCLGNKDIILSFGFSNSSNFLYLYLFMAIYSPFSFIIQFGTMYMVRRAEYQADAYAVKYGHAESLKGGLITLFKHNKGPLVVDPVYSALNYSHPTLIERLQAIDDQVKKERD